MILHDLRRIGQAGNVTIHTKGRFIVQQGNSDTINDPLQLYLNNAVVLPGLINSHDHLDFNLFPMLGSGYYRNYMEWGKSINRCYKKDIEAVLKIPLALRTQWGIYKNLLCGVTTVVNHGKQLPISNSPISIIQPAQNLHSQGFERLWKVRLNNPLKKEVPCVIHTSEGTDDLSLNEGGRLARWNLLKRELIAVHGLSMSETQARKMKALIWCPESNYFLFGKTAAISSLQSLTSVCFGTDSTLTGDWNIWHHLRTARKSRQVTDKELFDMCTTSPANLWKLDSGSVGENMQADLVVVKATANSYDAVFSIEPADILLVIQAGRVRLFDAELLSQFTDNDQFIDGFTSFRIGTTQKYVEGNLPHLVNKIRDYHPSIKFPISV